MSRICPHCGGREFLVTPHVTQDWLVDEDGEFLECLQECVEVTHKPDNDDIWACALCNYEAAGSQFDPDTYDPTRDYTKDEQGRKVYRRIISVHPDVIARVLGYVSARKPGRYQGEAGTISVTAKFPDGNELDVKCCGCKDAPSWTEAVLFNDHGVELCCTDCSEDYLGEWEIEHDGVIYKALVVPERVIDTKILADAYHRGLVKLTKSPNGDGIVCTIGSHWFYFTEARAGDYKNVSRYKQDVPKARILRSILDTLDEFRMHEEFMDEYTYYAAYLLERLPKKGMES